MDGKEVITHAVNQSLIIWIPGEKITFEDWQGIGYIKEDPETGEYGYMLTGMIAGGMSAWDIVKWIASICSGLLISLAMNRS